MKKYFIFLSLIFLSIFIFHFFISPISAQDVQSCINDSLNLVALQGFSPMGSTRAEIESKCLSYYQNQGRRASENISQSARLDNPLGDVGIFDIVANIIKTILGLVGVAALVMFIYGGILWMTSAGNAQRIEKGRETLTWAAIGLVVIFASYALVNLILKAFETGT